MRQGKLGLSPPLYFSMVSLFLRETAGSPDVSMGNTGQWKITGTIDYALYRLYTVVE